MLTTMPPEPQCFTCESRNVRLTTPSKEPTMPQGGRRVEVYDCLDCSARFVFVANDYRVVPITPETRIPSLDELLHNRP